MRVLYAVICEHAHERPDGRLDVHGVFHQLYAPGFPASQDRLVLALALEWDTEAPGRRELKIDLVDPSGSPCLTIRGHTDVVPRQKNEAPPRTLLVLPMEEVVFPAPGTHFFNLDVAGKPVVLAPLHLIEDPTLREHSHPH